MSALERRDRAVVVAALAAVTLIAWGYLLRIAAGMRDMAAMGPAMAMPEMHAWSAADVLLLTVMWTTMMVAMMLPSAAPMILLFASVNRRRRERATAAAPTAVFVAGYAVVWTAFSVAAALAQSILHRAALLSPAMVSTSRVLGGVLLVGAGVYQWTPIKRACLRTCRSPLGFLTSEWRDGARGAFVMGLRHGAVCLGCCWTLMALLFVAGVMNLLWVAAIAAFVLVEKVAPRGATLGRAGGMMLVVWGVMVLAR